MPRHAMITPFILPPLRYLRHAAFRRLMPFMPSHAMPFYDAYRFTRYYAAVFTRYIDFAT